MSLEILPWLRFPHKRELLLLLEVVSLGVVVASELSPRSLVLCSVLYNSIPCKLTACFYNLVVLCYDSFFWVVLT